MSERSNVFISVHPPLVWDQAAVSAARAGYSRHRFPDPSPGDAVPEGSHDPCGQFVGGSAGSPFPAGCGPDNRGFSTRYLIWLRSM